MQYCYNPKSPTCKPKSPTFKPYINQTIFDSHLAKMLYIVSMYLVAKTFSILFHMLNLLQNNNKHLQNYIIVATFHNKWSDDIYRRMRSVLP